MNESETKPEEKPYNFKYILENGQFSKEDIMAGPNGGGCQSIGLVSVIGQPGDGEQMSTLFIGRNKDNTEWTDNQWFIVWELLCMMLARKNQLDKGKQHFINTIAGVIQGNHKAQPTFEQELEATEDIPEGVFVGKGPVVK